MIPRGLRALFAALGSKGDGELRSLGTPQNPARAGGWSNSGRCPNLSRTIPHPGLLPSRNPVRACEAVAGMSRPLPKGALYRNRGPA
jgi:hypothetical protein